MDGRPAFDAREFLGNLKRDELSPPIILPGMVKPADDSDDYLMFAQGTVCENWVRIPVDSIESIDMLNLIPCGEHTHPLVMLRLKAPESDEGRVFAALMQAANQNRRGTSRRPVQQASQAPANRMYEPGRMYGPGTADRPGSADRTADHRGYPSRLVRGPRAGGSARAFDDPGITAEPRWRWCSGVPDIDIDDHGTWCLDWCWESAHQASYLPCDVLRTLTTE